MQSLRICVKSIVAAVIEPKVNCRLPNLPIRLDPFASKQEELKTPQIPSKLPAETCRTEWDSQPMEQIENFKVLFIAGFGPILREETAGRKLFGEALGVRFKEEQDGYLHTEALPGAMTFALWPLRQAAQSCFGTDHWPDDITPPQAWLEFDVDSVEKATAKLESQGYRMLVKNKTEPWGQTVSRFLTPEGLLIGVTMTPSLRAKNSATDAT